MEDHQLQQLKLWKLWSVGEEVLEKFGILKIDEQTVSIEIRNAIHKAVLDKYGPIALMIWVLNLENQPIGSDKTSSRIIKKKKKIYFGKYQKILALEKFFYYMKIADR